MEMYHTEKKLNLKELSYQEESDQHKWILRNECPSWCCLGPEEVSNLVVYNYHTFAKGGWSKKHQSINEDCTHLVIRIQGVLTREFGVKVPNIQLAVQLRLEPEGWRNLAQLKRAPVNFGKENMFLGGGGWVWSIKVALLINKRRIRWRSSKNEFKKRLAKRKKK